MIDGTIICSTAMFIFEGVPVLPDTLNIDDSPWYKIMEEKGEAWNQFAKEVGGDVVGSYNAELLSFEMKIEIRDVNIFFFGRRDLKSRVSLLIPRDGDIIEHLHIWFKRENVNTNSLFSVRRSSLWDGINSFFSTYASEKNIGHFNIRYNSEECLERLLNFQVLGYNNLWKIKCTEKRFDLVMGYLPSESKSLMTLLNFCGRMITDK